MGNQEMENSYIFVKDLRAETKAPESGIVSRTLHNDERSKVIVFSFAPGQELSAHTAPFPATLQFVKGKAALNLGGEKMQAEEGAFAYMPPHLEHGIKAETELILLLTMIKGKADSAS
jgi:quercetin dioxygenase-like cupin family protein